MHRKKSVTKLKSHQKLSLKIRNQQVLFPNRVTMLQPFIQVNRTSDRSRKPMERVKRRKLISLSIGVTCKDSGIICIVGGLHQLKGLFKFPRVLDNDVEKFRVM